MDIPFPDPFTTGGFVRQAIRFVLPALVAIGLAGCDRDATTAEKSDPGRAGIAQTTPVAPAPAQTSPAPTEAAAAAPAADVALSEKVREALVTERGINARDLQVNAQNGVVTLSGKVEEKSDRERMMLVAMSVDGVRSVVSNLVVERPA
jgi:hyperosmotically inducible protein